MVRASRRVTRKSAIAISTANSASASRGVTRRAASGRSRVRRTYGSMSRSTKSLMTQPAARITITPSTNTVSTRGVGRPAPAIHSAHRAGHSSSQVPTGRSSRMRRAYSAARRDRRCDSGASAYGGSSSGETAAIGGVSYPRRQRLRPHRADSGRPARLRIRGGATAAAPRGRPPWCDSRSCRPDSFRRCTCGWRGRGCGTRRRSGGRRSTATRRLHSRSYQLQ